MPDQFLIQVFKESPFATRPFSNTYCVTAADMPTAVSAADIIVAAEQDIYSAELLFTFARVSNNEPGNDSYVTKPYNVNGNTTATGQVLPLFNTLRIDITTSDFGRPTKMHYRNLNEALIVNNTIDGTFRSAMTALVNQLLDDLQTNSTPWIQRDGSELVDASAYPSVVQRSLHRRRRKPVL